MLSGFKDIDVWPELSSAFTEHDWDASLDSLRWAAKFAEDLSHELPQGGSSSGGVDLSPKAAHSYIQRLQERIVECVDPKSE